MSHALRFRITALSLLVALLIAVGGAARSHVPAAHANTTDVAVIGCEFIAGAIDGDNTNAISNADVQTACGGDQPGTNVAGYGTELPPTGARSIANLAKAIGNKNGVLQASDFRASDAFDESLDGNQLSTDCTRAGATLLEFASGLSCTLDVFVFVDHDQLVNFDLPTGLKSIESQSLSATCGIGPSCSLPARPVNLDFMCNKDDRASEGQVVGTALTSSGNAAIGPTILSTSAAGINPDVVTTTASHGLATGDTVFIAGAADPAVDGMHVITVTTPTTFTIAVTATILGGAAGTITQLDHALITTASAHGLAAGDVVTMSGSTETGLNGQWRVNAAPTATTFTVGNGLLGDSTGANPGADRIGAAGGGWGGTVTRDWAVGTDNDCNGGQDANGVANNGDGVVMFHVLRDTASRGSVLTVSTDQDAVAQIFDVNVVGSRVNVALTVAEHLIETNHIGPNVYGCQTTTPYSNGVAPPTSTVAQAVVTDIDNTVLTRVPVYFSITFSTVNTTDPARIGIGDPSLGIVGNTFFTVRPKTPGAPTAAYAVICGGTGTGSATIYGAIFTMACAPSGCTPFGNELYSTQPLTTGGAPSAVALTPAPPSLACDGANTSTLTAHITDWLGNDVADGVPVNFSVIGLGTANPINTVTAGGLASTQIKPLPAGSSGVAIVVGAGDSAIAPIAQQSTQVLCTAPPTPTPTPTATPGPGCAGDLDCDGIPDALDNCPSAPNPDQANTNLFNFALNRPGSDPRGDACDPDISGDGYGNVKKLALGKNLDIYCPIMRADVDGDGAVSILDLAKVAQWFTKSIPPAPQRYAQDADAQISILDLTRMAQVFTQHVGACP